MQNRDMAACMGVRTERVNMLTFAFGSGLAGLAGAFLSQIGNVGPSLGPELHRRQLHDGRRWRRRAASSAQCVSALGIGVLTRFCNNCWLTGARQNHGPGSDHSLFAMETGRALPNPKPQLGRLAPLRRRMQKSFRKAEMWRHRNRGAIVILGVLPALNAFVPESSVFHVSDFTINLYGKYLCYAMLAISVDLLWGYTGLLSLGQGLFFALGGYTWHVPDADDRQARPVP